MSESSSRFDVDDRELLRVLGRSQDLGYLGPAPLIEHVAHADALASVVGRVAGVLVDLGSGGGVPGLVLACRKLADRVVLVDGSERRCSFLRWGAVELFGPEQRDVEVVEGRAEALGQGPRREAATVVVARAFGGPAVTAECGSGLLMVGGRLIVSEPPDAGPEDRWPESGLRLVGLGPAVRRRAGGFSFAEMVKGDPLPARLPRRTGVPAKRPLF